MAVAISQEQFEVISGILADPETMAKLSGDQLLSLSGQVAAFQNSVNDRNKRLVAEGLSPEQIARVDQAAATAPPPNTGDVSGQQGITDDPLSQPVLDGLKVEAMVDGAQKSVVGVFDNAMDLSVGIHDTFGFGENEEDRAAWKAQVSAWRTEQTIKQLQEFGQVAPSGWNLAGEMAPWLFSLPASAETFVGLVAKRGVQGAAIGSSYIQGVDQTLIDRAFGATFGSGFGVLSAIPSVVSGLRKGMAKSFTRNFNNGNAKAADAVQQEVRRMTGDETFQFSIGQVTGGKKAVAIEMRAAGEETKAAQNNNLNILSRHFFTRSAELVKGGASPGRIAVELRNTLESIHKNVSDDASRTWRNAHNNLLDEFGDDIVIRGDEYLAKIDKMLREAEDIIQNPGGKGVKGLTQYRNKIDIEVNPIREQKNAKGNWQLYDRQSKVWLPTESPDRAAVRAVAIQQNADFGGLDVAATQRVMTGLNSLIGGRSVISAANTPGSNREVGRALMGNFTDALESRAANPEAVAGINAMRTQYADSMAYLQAVDDTIVARIFGGKKLPQDPGKKLDLVLRQEAEDLANTRILLETHNPALLEDLRASHLQRIGGGSLTGKNPMVDTEVALDKFLTRLEGSFQGTGMAGRGLHAPREQAEILAAAKALRIVKNKYFLGVAPDGSPGIDDVAINLVSRSPEFMARFVTRVVTTGKGLEAGMLDQSFRQAMEALSTQPLGSAPLMNAMVFLTMWTNKAQVEAEAEALNAERERNQKVLENDSNAFKRGD